MSITQWRRYVMFSSLTPTQKLVALALSVLVTETDSFHEVSRTDLMLATGLSARSVQKATKVLKQAGLILKIGQEGGRNRFCLYALVADPVLAMAI